MKYTDWSSGEPIEKEWPKDGPHPWGPLKDRRPDPPPDLDLIDTVTGKLDDIEANLVEAARLKRLMEVVIGFETALIVWLVLFR